MRYFIYDVFTDTPFEGNQLAVYPEPPRDIPVDRMQRIAAEMNYSETTFVLPPAGSGDVKMRIFTPGKELPLAGHPTIGTTFALADEGVIARGRDQFVFECQAARLRLRSTASASIPVPQANSASACGHRSSSPMPFRKIPRTMTRK